jgi:hypothetical protein
MGTVYIISELADNGDGQTIVSIKEELFDALVKAKKHSESVDDYVAISLYGVNLPDKYDYMFKSVKTFHNGREL